MFKVEHAKDILLEIAPLIHEHWEEIGTQKDKIELAPDFDRYLQLQDAGVLVCITARKEDGELIGYSLMLVNKSLHYSKDVFALNDIVFLKKEHRKGLLGYKLLKFTEAELKRRGVSKVYWHVKKDHNFGKLLERVGYYPEELNYSKYLGE